MNTLVEALRQPIYFILLGCGLILLLLSPYFTLFALLENNKIVKDMGLATILITGLFLSAFSASSVIYREIENRTILTIISKPVQRWSFILGKYFGIVFSLLIAETLLSLVFIHIVRTEITEAVTSPTDYPVLLGYLAATIFSLLMAAFANFFYQKPFIASAVLFALPIFILVFLALCLIGPTWSLQPIVTNLDRNLILAIVLIFLATCLTTSIAVAASTRLSTLPTLFLSLFFFLLGLFSDYILGRHAAHSLLFQFFYSIVPNLQIYWVVDAVLQERVIPLRYLVHVLGYSFFMISSILFLAMMLFQQKETE